MKAVSRHAFLLLLLLLWMRVDALAQRYPFYNLSVEGGLLQSQARNLAQDARGYLWIATLGGLSRYDGKTFRHYTVRNGMTSNTTTAVEAMPDGTLWVGSINGLSRFDGKTFQNYTLGHEGGQVTQLKTAPDGTLWCVSGGVVFSIFKDKIQRHSLLQSAARVTAILPTRDSAIWVAATDGFVYRRKGISTSRFAVPAVPGVVPVVLQMLSDRNGVVWIAASSGLYRVTGNAPLPAPIKGLIAGRMPPVLCLTEDRSGAIWGGLRSGAFRLQDSVLDVFNKRNGLTDNPIQSLLTDAEGNVWLASDGQGIYRYSGTQFTALDESTGLPSAQVMAIAADPAGKLFLGTYEASLFVYKRGQVRPLSIPGNPAITALRYRGNSLWIGTGGAGLWHYDSRTFRLIPQAKTKLKSAFITALYPDKKGRLWIGTANSAACLEEDTFRALPLAGTMVQDFLEIGEDSILLATDKGLQLSADNGIYPFKTGAAPDSSTPQCLTLQSKMLWIGTSENGLICYDMRKGKAHVFNKSNGLQSDFVYNLITDDSGDVWAGTGYGIHRIRYMGEGKPTIHFYGRAQGIAGMESNHNAVLKMPDGSIWFGTLNGALHYRPQQAAVQSAPVSVMLQSVTVFGEPVTDTNWFSAKDAWYGVPYGLRLPYQKNNITFTFGGISLSGGEALRYRYRLAGLDAPQSDWSEGSTITFSALPPGKYTLLVECGVEGGSSTLKTLSYPFEIITPFHKTLWFRLLIVAGCVLLGIAFQYLLNKRRRDREALIEMLRREEQAKVRERTAEDFHDEVGNKLTRINVLTNVLKKKVELNPDAERILTQIQDNTAQLYSGTRDILWSLKPSNDSLYEILHRIRDFGIDLFSETDIQFLFSGTDERWQQYRLPLDKSRNLIMIFKEALNNTLKYSGATEVRLNVQLQKDNTLHLMLTDNGKGFDLESVKRGHGINNMQVRTRRMDGHMTIHSSAEEGTSTHLAFPLPQE